MDDAPSSALERIVDSRPVRYGAMLTLVSGVILHGLKLAKGHDALPPITMHIGDFSLAYIGTMLVDSYASATQKGAAAARRTLGLGTLAVSAYFTLGETVLPQLLGSSTPDGWDIPAALTGAIGGYVMHCQALRINERKAARAAGRDLI